MHSKTERRRMEGWGTEWTGARFGMVVETERVKIHGGQLQYSTVYSATIARAFARCDDTSSLLRIPIHLNISKSLIEVGTVYFSTWAWSPHITAVHARPWMYIPRWL